VGSPLTSFVMPERNINRNRSAQTSHRIAVEGAGSRTRLRSQLDGRVQHRQQPRLEQQPVPLEPEEGLAGNVSDR